MPEPVADGAPERDDFLSGQASWTSSPAFPGPEDSASDAGAARARKVKQQAEADRADLERRAKFVLIDFPGGVHALPPDLRLLAVEGNVAPGDSGSPGDVPPAWYDAGLFLEGQRVATDNHAGLAEAEMLALFLLFAFPAGLDPLIGTGRSDTPEAAGRRYLSTNLRLLSWYSTDPFDPASEAHRNLAVVRRLHAGVRASCNSAEPEQLAVKFTVGKDRPRELLCPQAAMLRRAFTALPSGAYLGPCPALGSRAWQETERGVYKDPNGNSTLSDANGVPKLPPNGVQKLPHDAVLSDQASAPAVPAVILEIDRFRRPFLTQGEMAITQWAFFGLFISKPQVFAAPRISRREMEALVHMWAVLGYCLGIEDRFNWGLGGLDAVLHRSEVYLRMLAVPNLRALGADAAALARWEHMSRCMVDGIRAFVPMPALETSLAYLAEDVLEQPELAAPLRKALRWSHTFQLWRLRFILAVLPRWLPAWTCWMSRGLRRILRDAKARVDRDDAKAKKVDACAALH